MAGRGPVPKEVRSRKRDTQVLAEVAITGEVYGHPLPEGVLPDGEDWHPQTIATWEAFRRWPIMANLPDVSWQFLIDTMLQHHVMWTKGRWEFAGEVRLRVKSFFVTPDEQLRAGKSIKMPEATPANATASAKVTDIRDRRSRLSG